MSPAAKRPNLLSMNALDFNRRLRAARDLMQKQNHPAALSAYAELVKKYPQGSAWGEYARAATIFGDFDLAEQIWKRLRETQPNTAELLSRLAWEYQNIRMHAKARELYREAVALEPDNLPTQLGLAWVLSRTNSPAEARVVVNKCLELDASSEQARYLAAHLDRRENKLAEAEKQFRDLLARKLSDQYVPYFCHAELAAILDQTGRYDEAMDVLQRGKKLIATIPEQEKERENIDAWHEDVLRKTKALPRNILDIWKKSFPPKARTPAASVAFLTGSARSGTTLLERILDAHPSIAAADESLAFSKVFPLIDTTAAPMPGQRLGVLRQRYLHILSKITGPPAPGKVLLDKNPSQTAWLPAFLRAFPDLRVLIALRDPRDILVSLYFQNQTSTNHLTFEQLARHYQNVMDIWLAAREWDGFAWMETRYEDVVADLGKEGARATRFLGLEWHANQGEFHERNREKPIMSNNYQDVTRPVYKRSVGRWQVYEKYLAPALPMLEPYCKRFGYA